MNHDTLQKLVDQLDSAMTDADADELERLVIRFGKLARQHEPAGGPFFRCAVRFGSAAILACNGARARVEGNIASALIFEDAAERHHAKAKQYLTELVDAS